MNNLLYSLYRIQLPRKLTIFYLFTTREKERERKNNRRRIKLDNLKKEEFLLCVNNLVNVFIIYST